MKLLFSKSLYQWRDLKLSQFWLKCKLAPTNVFANRCWIQYQQFSHLHPTSKFLRLTPLYRALHRMEQIEQLLSTAPDDLPPPHIKLQPNEKFIANIKLSGYGFLPKEVILPQHRRPPSRDSSCYHPVGSRGKWSNLSN